MKNMTIFTQFFFLTMLRKNTSSNFHSSCSSDHVGEYCQYKNPCNSAGQRCLNGGTCTVILVTTGEPSFQVPKQNNF